MALDAFALILLTLGLGLLFARLRVLPDNSADVLNRVVLYLCLPAAVLSYVPRLHLERSLLGLMVTPGCWPPRPWSWSARARAR